MSRLNEAYPGITRDGVVRVSDLVRKLRCDGSFFLPRVESEPSPEMLKGTDIHKKIAESLGAPISSAHHEPEVSRAVGFVMKEFESPSLDVEWLVEVSVYATLGGRDASAGVFRPSAVNAIPESTHVVVGTPDFVCVNHDHGSIVVVDWKTCGSLPDGAKPDHEVQLQIYMKMCQAVFRGYRVGGRVVYLSGSEMSVYDVDPSSFSLSGLSGPFSIPPNFMPGPHCSRCPSAKFCPVVISSQTEDPAIAYGTIVATKKAIEQAEEEMRRYILENGPIDVGDGMQYGPGKGGWRVRKKKEEE